MSHGEHEKLTQKPSRKQKVLAGNRLGFGGNKLVLMGTNKSFGGKHYFGGKTNEL